MENLAPYQVKREAGLYMFVPSPLYAGLRVGGFGAGSAFLVYLSTLFFHRTGAESGTLWFGAIFLLVAAFSAGLGIRAWRTRSTSLTIEPGGHVRYGEQELCLP